MASFSAISASRVVPEVRAQLAPYDAFWHRMREQKASRNYGAVQHIEFCHATEAPGVGRSFVITRSTNVEVIDQDTLEVVKRYKMFKEAAYSATFRQDGRLIAVGGEEKFMRLIETASDSVLRILSGHRDAVHAVRFMSDRRTVLSCSDDATVRLWDIASAEQVYVSPATEFKDYVRCCATSLTDDALFFAGSYDHTCRLFDKRQPSAAATTINCGQPVESVLLYPTDKLAIVAAGNSVSIYDLVAGGKRLAHLTSHHKTVTCLCMVRDGAQFLTGSVDRHVKVVSSSDFDIVRDLPQASPVLSLGIADDMKLLAVGCADGVMKMYKQPAVLSEAKLERQAFMREPLARRRRLGPLLQERFYTPHAQDSVVVVVPDNVSSNGVAPGGPLRSSVKGPDMHLKRFNAAKTFDAIINPQFWTKSPEKTVTTILELSRRGSLRNVLRTCSDFQLKALLSFLNKFSTDPQYSAYLLRLIEMLIEERPSLLGQNPKVDHIFMRLCGQVERETAHAKHLLEAKGMMETLLGQKMTMDGNVSLDLESVTVSNACVRKAPSSPSKAE